MMVFIYTFIVIFIGLTLILGIGNLLLEKENDKAVIEGEATAAMCTTQLLGKPISRDFYCDEDFIIEQDMVYTYDSFNL
jgi:hypothetical protein